MILNNLKNKALKFKNQMIIDLNIQKEVLPLNPLLIKNIILIIINLMRIFQKKILSNSL